MVKVDPDPATPSELATQCYEALRAVALRRAPEAGPALGLALFLRQGLSGWMEALTEMAPTASSNARIEEPISLEGSSVLSAAAQSSLTRVLVSMALAPLGG